MRIVGGMWKGRPLEAPEGRDVTRPTTDRVREAMASMVASARGLDLSGVRALDAFAGSGALGLELASRGASHVTLVEQDRGSAARIRRNVSSLGAPSSLISVVVADVDLAARKGSLPGAPFDVVLLDPPYAREAASVSGLVESLSRSGLLARAALVVYERLATRPTLELADATCVRQKRYGQTAVDLLRFGG
jgi:16S rRNA (guanine966-N2)-methyltransferase